MSTGEITFSEIERNADRTVAYALLVRLAKNYLTCIYWLKEVNGALQKLLGALTPQELEGLTAEQVTRITKRLQELHPLLVGFSRSHEADVLRSLPVIGNLTAKMQDATEDLDDIIEDLVLRDDPGFRSLISNCASDIGLSFGGSIAGMHR